jgi:hypothetical protein
MHRADYRDVVDMLSDMLKKLANFDPAFTVPFECERRAKRRTRAPLGLQIVHRQRFAVKPRQRRFRIESVDVRGAAIGEDMNDSACLSGEMRRSRRQGGVAADGFSRRRCEQILRPQQICQSYHPEAQPASAEKVPAGQKEIFEPGPVVWRIQIHPGDKFMGLIWIIKLPDLTRPSSQ